MRDYKNCKHEYVIQTKRGIPSLLPFYCKHCGIGSWYPTTEEEDKARNDFMGKLKCSLKGNKEPRMQAIKKYLGVN